MSYKNIRYLFAALTLFVGFFLLKQGSSQESGDNPQPNTNIVKLIWDPSPSEGDIKYKVYKDGEFLEMVDGVELVVNLEKKTSFYVTAIDLESGLESEPSNTVTWYPRPQPPTTLRIALAVDVPNDEQEMLKLIQRLKGALEESGE